MAIIDVVKFDGLRNREWIVYKHYAEDLSTATQLIVSEGQVAVFLKNGTICDMFGPGRYTLSTENIPILRDLIKLPFGRRTPFTAEIYYINTTAKLDLAWGTSDPIPVIDPKYHVRLRIRAFGQVGMKINNYRLFIQELIGAMAGAEIVRYDKVLGFFKGFLISKVKSIIAQIIINQQISALEISAKLNDISDQAALTLEPDFNRFGMTLINFYIKSINFPDEDFEKINDILEDKAAFEIMGDARYATKRSFDVYEGAATNENGAAGVLAAGGIGLGAGAAIYGAGGGLGRVMEAPYGGGSAVSAAIICPSCNASNPQNSKFCNSCGAKLGRQDVVNCPVCKAENRAGASFCSECGAKLTAAPSECECGYKLSPNAKFCPNCGRKVGE